MKKTLASILLFLTATNSPSFAADGPQTNTATGAGLIAYDELASGLLVSLLIVGIYAYYWFKQRA